MPFLPFNFNGDLQVEFLFLIQYPLFFNLISEASEEKPPYLFYFSKKIFYNIFLIQPSLIISETTNIFEFFEKNIFKWRKKCVKITFQ